MYSRGPISPQARVIYLAPEAPAKPAAGAACNGCGVCCVAETCPVGMVLFRQRRGPCPGLRWEPQQKVYRCGVVTHCEHVVNTLVPFWMGFAAPWLARALDRGARRWIAVGAGCDSNLEAAPQHTAVTRDVEKQP